MAKRINVLKQLPLFCLSAASDRPKMCRRSKRMCLKVVIDRIEFEWCPPFLGIAKAVANHS